MSRKGESIVEVQFADADGTIKPLLFKNPVKIIVAETIDQVIPCLEKVQAAVKSGLYAAGFVSYEAAPAFDSAFIVREKTKLPYLWFGLFNHPLEEKVSGTEAFSVSEWQPDVSRQVYTESISKIKEYIEQGDTYQVNYAIRLNATWSGDEATFYQQLTRAQSSQYSAFIQTDDWSVLSVSPELFFRVEGRTITTRPMKGTVRRGNTAEEDQELCQWLASSEKNQAENVMIVDLLRNDLGMIAKPGTVDVSSLFDIEQYQTVHQMTSTITAELEQETTVVDIFRALFPCGSITGAPKISTMKVIAELETTSREVYCGAIGYLSPTGKTVFNVPIRTVIIDKKSGKAQYGVGGGITWDSTDHDEYQEILTKAKVLKQAVPPFMLLESILLSDGSYFLLESHLNRIEQSAAYFHFSFNRIEINQELMTFAKQHSHGKLKVRILLANDGIVQVEGNEIVPLELQHTPTVALADDSINKDTIFLYHKTTNRQVYTYFQEKSPDFFDVLLWNEDEELTEFTNGNLVVELDGSLYTPPVTAGLLAGTFRQNLITNREISEKIIKLTDLPYCTQVWLINSVRGWVQVKFKEV